MLEIKTTITEMKIALIGLLVDLTQLNKHSLIMRLSQ